VPRGGAGRNQGRKKAVERLLIRRDAGRWCENRWRELSEQTAKQRREKRDQVLKTSLTIQTIQERISDTTPLKQRRSRAVQDTLEEVGDDVDAVLKSRRMSRVQLAKLKRPKGAKGKSERAAVIAEAVEWLKTRWGKTVTPYQMGRLWSEFRRSNEYKQSLKTHRN
jgi:hypothetical protein